MAKKRNDLDICVDILEVAKEGARKTRIVYRANLNFKIVKGYLKRLMNTGMIASENGVYTTTEKGGLYLGQYHELKFIEETRYLKQ